jgi:hypothetical protein
MSAVPRYDTAHAEVKSRGFFQSLLCGLGSHRMEEVGLQTETRHRYSDTHEAVYLVTLQHTLLRCACCGLESRRVDSIDHQEEGHYERVYVRRS